MITHTKRQEVVHDLVVLEESDYLVDGQGLVLRNMNGTDAINVDDYNGEK